MYWCKSKPNIFIFLTGGILLAICATACKPDAKENGTLKYFDLNGYFTKESLRLAKENKTVLKTVTHNSDTESRTVHIANWELELDLFKSADINRPAWKNGYTVIDEDSVLIYKAKTPDLKVREILIRKNKGKVKWILIYDKTPESNWLGFKVRPLNYTTEKLSYFPDSLYLIEKDQHVRLMGNNHYRIQGVIVH
jgi:hypothetical protein